MLCSSKPPGPSRPSWAWHRGPPSWNMKIEYICTLIAYDSLLMEVFIKSFLHRQWQVDGNWKRRPPFPFPRRKRPFPCKNGTAVSMWKRDVVSPAARGGRQAPIVWVSLPQPLRRTDELFCRPQFCRPLICGP
eukprot:309344-Chlamydomonas_euryale.AAC.1